MGEFRVSSKVCALLYVRSTVYPRGKDTLSIRLLVYDVKHGTILLLFPPPPLSSHPYTHIHPLFTMRQSQLLLFSSPLSARGIHQLNLPAQARKGGRLGGRLFTGGGYTYI